jgi:hypothetical protein
MKILHEEKPWPSKVNFVDENEVHLGYDTFDDCCSYGGWFLSDKKADDLHETFKEESMTLDGWVFDPAYFEQRGDGDGGGYCEFRIVNGGKEKFITIYNLQNGYYSKGFKFVCPPNPSRNREDLI